MLKKKIIVVVIMALFAVGAIVVMRIQPDRVPNERSDESEEVEDMLDKAAVLEEDTIAKAQEDEQDQNGEEGAGTFTAKVECSNGTFVLEIHPEWAPIGAAQFKEAVEAGVYDGARFFRVIPGFMAQFGISGDPAIAQVWGEKTIQDEPVIESNTRGMVTFAKTRLPNSRTTQLFINFGNNSNLDGMGFSPFGKVIEGMEVVDSINPEYREQPDQGLIETRGTAYLDEFFPRLDYIKSVTIVEDE